jgi:hypothetical protein
VGFNYTTGSFFIQLKGSAGVRFRTGASLSSNTVRVLRTNAEVRFYGVTKQADGYLWMRVFNGLDGGWIAYLPEVYSLQPRTQVFNLFDYMVGDPNVWYRLKHPTGQQEILTTDIHEKGFRIVKNSHVQEYLFGEDRVRFLWDSSPYEGAGYQAKSPNGVAYIPYLWSPGDSFEFYAKEVEWRSLSNGTLLSIPSPDHRLTFHKHHANWTSVWGHQLPDVIEVRITFLDNSPFETHWYAKGVGLVGFRLDAPHEGGNRWSSFNGFAMSTNARPTAGNWHWRPNLIGNNVNDQYEQPITPPAPEPEPVGRFGPNILPDDVALSQPPPDENIRGAGIDWDRIIAVPPGLADFHIDERIENDPFLMWNNDARSYLVKPAGVTMRGSLIFARNVQLEPGWYQLEMQIDGDDIPGNGEDFAWSPRFNFEGSTHHFYTTNAGWRFNMKDHSGQVFRLWVQIEDPITTSIGIYFHTNWAQSRGMFIPRRFRMFRLLEDQEAGVEPFITLGTISGTPPGSGDDDPVDPVPDPVEPILPGYEALVELGQRLTAIAEEFNRLLKQNT